ncbi:hypothetical protein C1645_823188 [Glomus cerebriforme]|uniref:Rad60/SUMO-like domain-containing protein n=1 Tax=Glomus cerebriforme TaxID=658196 RepID=A0A397T627_9GLOM|nr:hypothetical protein C1645_823188 [Glomus cerebriforme]
MSSDEEIIPRRQITKIKPRTFLPKTRRVVTSDSPLTGTSASVTQSPISPSKTRPNANNDDEDDTFFTRKTAFSRKMTSKKSRKSEILRTLEDNPKLPTNDTEREERPNRKAKSKVKGKSSSLDWTISDEPIMIVDEESDHFHFSDLSDDTEDRKKPNKNPDENKRLDDKEDSLTPPPEINYYLLQSTLAPLHATLTQYSGALRSDGNEIGSPIKSSSQQDDIELDPELLAIQQSVRQEENSNKSVDAKVEILVNPKRFPNVSVVTDENTDYDKPIKFIIKAEDTFEQLITHLCFKKGIPKQDLVLTYKNVKVFPRGTPSSLGMSGLVHLESYTKESYVYFKEQQGLERKRLLEKLEEDYTMDVNNTLFSGRDIIDIETNNNGMETTMNEEDNYLHLKFQCQDETVEKLKVKKSLTVQAVIERYKKIKEISGNVIIKLIFEDEVLSPNEKLINTDLEDGDILSVKII